MDLTAQIDNFVEQLPSVWQADACGVTRSETPIPVLLHTDAYVPDTSRTRVLLIAGLTGATADVECAFDVLQSYVDRGAPIQSDIALSAIPCGNPRGLALGVLLSNGSSGNPSKGYPPQGRFYDDPHEPEARYLWRWIGFNAPDVVLEVCEGHNVRWEFAGPIKRIADALNAYPITGNGSLTSALASETQNNLAAIPTLSLTCPKSALIAEIDRLWRLLAPESALRSSPARSSLDRRRERTPLETAHTLAKSYGHALNPVIYTQGVALSGRLRLAELDPDAPSPAADIERLVKGYASCTIQEAFGESNGGANLAGLVWADELADATDDPHYTDLLVSVANSRYRPAIPGDIPPASDADYRVEDMFFGAAVLGRAQRVTGDASLLDIHTRFLLDANVQQENGLFWHCRDAEWFWGRGNGFAALGYAETLTYLPSDHPDRRRLREQHRRHLSALKAYQQPSGMWRQIIDFPGSYQEMTATCMIGYALARGIRRGWLDATDYEDTLAMAWQGVNERIDDEGGLVDVCTGTGVQSSTRDYLDRPAIFGWDERGGAMALWFACEMEQYLRHRSE